MRLWRHSPWPCTFSIFPLLPLYNIEGDGRSRGAQHKTFDSCMATMSFHGCGPLGIQTNVENRLFQDPNSVLPSPTTFFNSLTGGPLISPVAFDALSSINESGQSREPSPYETASFSAVASDRGSSPASSYLATPGPASPEQPGMLDYKFATSNASYTSLGAEAFGLQQFAQHQNPTSDPGWYSALTLQPQQPQQHVATSYGMPTPPQAFETPQGFVFFVPHSAPPTAVTSVPQFQQAADEPVAQPQPILPLAPGPTTTLLDWDADQFAAFDADQHSHPVTELAKPAKKNAKSSGPRKPVGSLDKKKRNGKQSVTTKRFVSFLSTWTPLLRTDLDDCRSARSPIVARHSPATLTCSRISNRTSTFASLLAR